MKVIAAQGLKVPTEQNPREYITEADAVEIEVTAYYLRRLADRELIEVAPVATGDAAGQADPTDAASGPKASRTSAKA